jgi:hypothetical protein
MNHAIKTINTDKILYIYAYIKKITYINRVNHIFK